jgi:phosphodiesterase/alkaline phosphatase D-like protein
MPPSEYPSNLGNPFTLGVTSGDPAPEGFVLWTEREPFSCIQRVRSKETALCRQAFSGGVGLRLW